MKKFLDIILFALIAVAGFLFGWFLGLSAQAQTPSEIILEEPRPAIVMDPPRFIDAVDQPDIPPQRPPSRDFVDQVDLGGLEEIFDVGQDWDDDCKMNVEEDEILTCRLTW